MTKSGSRSGGSGRAERFLREIPEGDTLPRLVCRDCGFIHYENPRIVGAQRGRPRPTAVLGPNRPLLR